MYAINRSTYSLIAGKRQGGASIITAIFLITGLAVLAALMTKLTIFGNTKSVKEWNAARALYAAESAVSAAAYDIVNLDNCAGRGDTNVAIDAANNISATYSATCTSAGEAPQTVNLYLITATGTAGTGDFQAQRRIVVQFAP